MGLQGVVMAEASVKHLPEDVRVQSDRGGAAA